MVYGNGGLEIAWDWGWEQFFEDGREKSVLGKGYVVIRFWKLLRSLFLKNMGTVSHKRGIC